MKDHTERPFSSLEAVQFGWAITKTHLKPLLVIGAAGFFLALLLRALAQPSGDSGLRPLLQIVVQLLQPVVAMAYTRAALMLHDGKAVEELKPADFLPEYFSFLLTSVLYGVIVATGVALLVVPGVIWALMFGYATFLVIDQKSDPILALRESRRLTAGAKTHLLGFVLLLACVNFLGALAFGVGLLVTIPTSFIAAAYVFRRLQARAAARPPATPQPQAEVLCKSANS